MKTYDVIVVGAGHAGCEAALAPARLGHRTLVITVNVDHIGDPAIRPWEALQKGILFVRSMPWAGRWPRISMPQASSFVA